MNICSSKAGIFCSSVRTEVLVQYYKKVMVDFLAELLRFLLNFLLLSFNYYKLMLLTDSKFRLRPVIIRSVLMVILTIGILLNWSNIFHSQINFSNPNNNYPISALNSESFYHRPKQYLKYLNAVNKLINYGLF